MPSDKKMVEQIKEKHWDEWIKNVCTLSVWVVHSKTKGLHEFQRKNTNLKESTEIGGDHSRYSSVNSK